MEQLRETQYVVESNSGEPIFLLVDSSSDELTSEHSATIREFLPAGVIAAHLDGRNQKVFVDRIADRLPAEDRADAVRLLLPEGVSYGRGPNLAALFAASTSCTSIHRRDSDGFHDPSRPNAWPIELELRALGEPYLALSDPSGSVVATDEAFRSENIALAGSGMFGSPTIDRRELFDTSEKLGVRLQALGRPGVNEEAVRHEARGYLIAEPRIRYETDFYSFSDSARVEMGNVGLLASSTELIPEMPTGIIGCDYMVKDLLWRLGRPEVFHSRKLLHLFDAARDSKKSAIEDQVDYMIRDVQYLQFGRIHALVGKAMSSSIDSFESDGVFLSLAYASSFREAAYEAASELVRVRVGAAEVYKSAAEIATDDLAIKFGRVHNELLSRCEEIDFSVVSAVMNFARLIELWPSLLAAANLVDALEFVR